MKIPDDQPKKVMAKLREKRKPGLRIGLYMTRQRLAEMMLEVKTGHLRPEPTRIDLVEYTRLCMVEALLQETLSAIEEKEHVKYVN